MKNVSYIDDFETWKSEFSFNIPIRVRFSETDMYQHVNNVSAFIYFEQARIDYLDHVGFLEEMQSENGAFVVADLQCDYHRQMFFNEKLRVYVKTNEIGNTSFDIHYMVLNSEDKITLTGRGRLVYIDPKSGKTKVLTSQMKDMLQR